MTTILQNAVVAKKVTATAEDENYRYNVAYEATDKSLNIITANVVFKKDGKYAGDISYQNANKTISGVPDTADASAILAMLDGIITEIKSTLTV